jgi:hypothetical protein
MQRSKMLTSSTHGNNLRRDRSSHHEIMSTKRTDRDAAIILVQGLSSHVDYFSLYKLSRYADIQFTFEVI